MITSSRHAHAQQTLTTASAMFGVSTRLDEAIQGSDGDCAPADARTLGRVVQYSLQLSAFRKLGDVLME